ncbi:MAG: hypothetical protein EBU07_19975 [Betaproteobacteria bacterium]|nr:hypothetical protein [Betaproteobacteria bacterium]
MSIEAFEAQLGEDMKDAMRAKDQVRLEAVRSIRAAHRAAECAGTEHRDLQVNSSQRAWPATLPGCPCSPGAGLYRPSLICQISWVQ